MTFQVKVKEVTVENVVKGKSRYSIAHVVHDFKGETRTQKIMSFANPEVFKRVQNLKEGDLIEITVTKNDAGYNQWAKVDMASDKVEADTPERAPSQSTGRVIGSNYETPQERADNRVRIVRQSSLSNAIATLAAGGNRVDPADVLDQAQRYFDWVYEEDDSDETDELVQ